MAGVIEVKSFPCMAEGIAHYYNQGFVDEVDYYVEPSDRILANKLSRREVLIRQVGKTEKERFMNYEAKVINL
jgi:hypothetical protein